MPAATVDLFMEQGATFIQVYEYKDIDAAPIDLTGYTARMQARLTKASSTPLFTATTENSKIVIDGPAGRVTVTIPATETEDFTFTDAVYDLEIVDDPLVIRLAQGSIRLDPEVTRD